MCALRIELLNDGFFRLDGGAMFGMVPKPLWSRLCEPDARNRIQLRAGALLIRTEQAVVLADTGLGAKLSGKARDIYAFDVSRLLQELAERGLAPEDVTHVLLTHLHLDHAGGCTRMAENGKIEPVFTNAEHFAQASEWDAAMSGHPLTRGSYRKDDFAPLRERGQLTLLDGDSDIGHGIAVLHTGAHSPGHQIVRIETPHGPVLFLGDLVPTAFHVRLPYVMAYDAFPLDAVRQKETWLRYGLDNGCRVFLQHDPAVASGTLRREGDAIALVPDPCPTLEPHNA